MPNIKGIDLSNGIKILSGEVNLADLELSHQAIQNYLNTHTITQCEDYANKFLENHFKNETIRVHIYSTSPLRYTVFVTDKGNPVPDNWWE